MKHNYSYGTGRRKSSEARICLKSGEGNITIKGTDPKKFFKIERDYLNIITPLEVLDSWEKFDIKISVKGGGTSGQSGAIRLGIARALMDYDISLKPLLRAKNLITRDSRQVERKKVGFRKARKKRQFSKR